MRLIKFLLRFSPKLILLAIAAGVICGAANTALLAIISAVLTGRPISSNVLAGAFVGLCLVVALFRIANELLLAELGQNALVDLRMQLCRKILGIPLRNLEELGAHRIMAVLNEDVPSITNVVTTMPTIFINAAVVLTCLVFLGWLNWVLLLAVLALMVLGTVTYQLPIIRAIRHGQRAREAADVLQSHFRALTDGFKELKLHGERREAFMTGSLQATSEKVREHQMNLWKIYTVASSWGQLLVFIVIGLLLFGARWLTSISLPVLTGYALTILYMMNPLQLIMNVLPTMSRASIALKKVEDLGLELTARATENVIKFPLKPQYTWKTLELDGVMYSYKREGEDQNFVLGPIDLTFYPGELVFLVGGNGSGKTTLAKIIVGLYAPESGEVRFNGQTLTDETRELYRSNFSVVFTDFYLFDTLLGLDSPELDERAQEYLQQLQLSNKVSVKDGALSTTGLSQGQRKRLALLTAYLEDRPIYLFDEWAADQDPYFKEIFYLQLLPELKARGKTIIVISHDDRYYHVGDRVVKLEESRLAYDEPLLKGVRGVGIGSA